MMQFMLFRSHQSWRYLFQALWLLIFAALLLAGAPMQLWWGLLFAALASTLLLKRAACSFACPLFALGELLWRSGARRLGRNVTPPFWFDLPLRTAKYLLLGWMLAALLRGEPAAAFPSVSGAVIISCAAALLILSLFLQMPWCRYLCPCGALLGLVSVASLLKIRRTPRHCVRCHRCDSRCPANLPVMFGTSVHSAECFACSRCVDGCPAPGALAFASSGNRAIPAWRTGLWLTLLLLLGLGFSAVY